MARRHRLAPHRAGGAAGHSFDSSRPASERDRRRLARQPAAFAFRRGGGAGGAVDRAAGRGARAADGPFADGRGGCRARSGRSRICALCRHHHHGRGRGGDAAFDAALGARMGACANPLRHRGLHQRPPRGRGAAGGLHLGPGAAAFRRQLALEPGVLVAAGAGDGGGAGAARTQAPAPSAWCAAAALVARLEKRTHLAPRRHVRRHQYALFRHQHLPARLPRGGGAIPMDRLGADRA